MGTPKTTGNHEPPLAAVKPSLWAQVTHRLAKIGHAAGEPGVGMVLSVFLIADAFAIGQACAWPSGNASLVGSLISAPCGGGCRLFRRSTPLICTKSASGTWSVRIPALEDDHEALEQLYAQSANQSGVALVTVQRSSRNGMGLWSPLIECQSGRWLQVSPMDPTLTPQDESAAATAVLNAWPAMVTARTVPLADWPLQQYEADAMAAGRRGHEYSLRWGWLANDAAVFGAITLLFLGHPRRAQRRREARVQHAQGPMTHCPNCRYDLTGLTVDRHGDRTCPECGRVCGQFF